MYEASIKSWTILKFRVSQKEGMSGAQVGGRYPGNFSA
jgi:hypothetical protein